MSDVCLLTEREGVVAPPFDILLLFNRTPWPAVTLSMGGSQPSLSIHNLAKLIWPPSVSNHPVRKLWAGWGGGEMLSANAGWRDSHPSPFYYFPHLQISFADPGSRIRNLVPFWPLDPDPGSGIGFFRIPDLGYRISDPRSWIPTPYFLELSDKFLDKKFYNSLKTGPKFFSSAFKK